jgi:hypothetical protein
MAARDVLVHANGEDETALRTALRVVRQAAEELPAGTRFHVIVQGPLVAQLTVGSDFTNDLATTVSDTVEVAACRNSLQRAGIDPGSLQPVVTSVPSAGAYLAARQWDGWAYLRY